MKPFRSREARVDASDALCGWAIPTRAELDEFSRAADAYLAKREPQGRRFLVWAGLKKKAEGDHEKEAEKRTGTV